MSGPVEGLEGIWAHTEYRVSRVPARAGNWGAIPWGGRNTEHGTIYIYIAFLQVKSL